MISADFLILNASENIPSSEKKMKKVASSRLREEKKSFLM
jgi:hypothetical protein